jgi:hypothetical protein
MTDQELQEKILATLERIEGLLSDAIGAYTLGTRDIHMIYKQKREARKRRRAGGSHTRAQWQALKRRYNFTCLKCRRTEPEIKLTRDHVDPAGSDDIENIQPLCEDCNIEKGDSVIDYREDT